jgi:hypothetical protein
MTTASHIPYPAPEIPLDIEHNPFWVLGITPRDSSQRIVEVANEKSVTLDSDLCAKARATLTNPRNRIAAELAWLPGLSPSNAKGALSLLRLAPAMIFDREGDPPLTQANLLASAFSLLDTDLSAPDWARWICRLGTTASAIRTDDVLRLINEDRIAANIPQIGSSGAIESEIANRKQFFKDTIIRTLDRLPSHKLVEIVTLAVDQATNEGANHAPSLIDDLVDSYELEVTKFLRQEADNIIKVITHARIAAKERSSALPDILKRLDELTRNWDRLAQPIQVSMKGRGMDHDTSRELAGEIRSLCVDLVNDYGLLDEANQLLLSLKEVFAELPEVMHRLTDDTKALDNLFEQRSQSAVDEEQWKASIVFNTQIGAVFKDELSLSHEGIRWKNQSYPLETITRVRWGATRHSVNGIPTGTTYYVWFGDNRRLACVETRKQEVFQEFTSKLWDAVCFRLLIELIASLANGDRIRFSDAVVHDEGIELSRHGLFGANGRVALSWGDVHIWNQDGCFYLGSKDDKKAYVALSYQEIDNVHVLEGAIRAFFKKGGPRISSAMVPD